MNILNKLTIKHLKLNKKRTIVTIIGIMLSTALMVGIGLLVSSFIDYSVRETINYSGDYYLSVDGVNKKEINDMTSNKLISDYYTKGLVGYHTLEKTTYTKDFISYKYLEIIDTKENYLKKYELSDGKYPSSKDEIILTEKAIKKLNKKLNDNVTLNIGTLSDDEIYEMEVQNPVSKQYKIVGIIKDEQISDEYESMMYAFTTDNLNQNINLYLKTKKANDVYDLKDDLESTYSDKSYEFNDSLLMLKGSSKYNNINKVLYLIIAFVLTLLSIGCSIVIYNSFAISVMERKKQFGLFSSIGATKKQIKKTVYYEALIVGTIGIVLGLIASFVGIYVTVCILNKLMSAMLGDIPLRLVVYKSFIIIPILFMILVIYLSARKPARVSSKITPIEAIRQNDDIKINKKKIKTSKLSRKLFGIEGEISLKNIKRNKKKYRITIISLVTSITLFLSFSSILNYIFYGVDEVAYSYDTDIEVSYGKIYSNNDKNIELENKEALKNLNKLARNKEVEKASMTLKGVTFYTDSINDNMYNKAYIDTLKSQGYEYITYEYKYKNKEYNSLNVSVLDNKSYENLKKEYNLKENRPILVDYFKTVDYSDNNRKTIITNKYNNIATSLNICDFKNAVNKDKNDSYKVDASKIDCTKDKISNIYVTDKVPFSFMSSTSYQANTLIINEDMYNEINKDIEPTGFSRNGTSTYVSYKLSLKVSSYTDLVKELDKLKKDNEAYYYENIKDELKQVNNMVLGIKILFYGFIALVTLIGVTSVINTLNTSIALRKKEFAMLRSVGLTPKGFNKMIIFESIYFGIKSLLIGIPLGLILTYLFHLITSGIVDLGFIIPFKSIIIAIIFVFLIILITMRYATSKIKKTSIIDTIREENI